MVGRCQPCAAWRPQVRGRCRGAMRPPQSRLTSGAPLPLGTCYRNKRDISGKADRVRSAIRTTTPAPTAPAPGGAPRSRPPAHSAQAVSSVHPPIGDDRLSDDGRAFIARQDRWTAATGLASAPNAKAADVGGWSAGRPTNAAAVASDGMGYRASLEHLQRMRTQLGGRRSRRDGVDADVGA